MLKLAKPNGQPCDESYKQCGILDSLGQVLCWPENEECPINQIEFSTSSSPSDNFTNKEAVKVYPLNETTYLHTSNAEINSPVISDIVIGPELFCINEDERGTGPPKYKYESSSSSGTCTKYLGHPTDYHYTAIDSSPKNEVYKQNGILSAISDFFSHDYPLNKLHDYHLYLYKHNYIGFNLTCLGDTPLSSEAFQYTKEDENFVWLLNLIIVIFSFVQVIPASLLIPCYDRYMFRLCIVYSSGLIITCPFVIFSFYYSLGITNTIYDCAESTISQGMEKLLAEDFGLQLSSLCLFSLNVLVLLILIGYEQACCSRFCSKKDTLEDRLVKEECIAELKTL